MRTISTTVDQIPISSGVEKRVASNGRAKAPMQPNQDFWQ